MSKVNIVSVQMRPAIGKKQKNLNKVAALLEENLKSECDLILVPEFFNTGISVEEFKKLAETEENNETIEFLAKIAQKYNSYLLAGSIIEKKDGNLYNTSRLLDRNGKCIAVYRKIHLFDSFGGEEHTYCSRGDEIVVADTDFGKIGMSVCFDIKFPGHFLELVKRGAEIIVEPAAWAGLTSKLEQDIEQWKIMNRARALDNVAYFVSSNQCGKVYSFLTACGHSMICAPDGQVIAQAEHEECVVQASIDTDMLRKRRDMFNMKDLVTV